MRGRVAVVTDASHRQPNRTRESLQAALSPVRIHSTRAADNRNDVTQRLGCKGARTADERFRELENNPQISPQAQKAQNKPDVAGGRSLGCSK